MTQTAMNAEVASISPIAVAEHVLSPNMRLHTDALIAYFQRLVQAGEDIDIAKSYLQTLHDISHFVDLKSCLVSDLTGRREPRLSRETLLQFGKLLKDRRLQARLSRAALGKKTGLSEATIKFIETARTRPTRGTLLRLMLGRRRCGSGACRLRGRGGRAGAGHTSSGAGLAAAVGAHAGQPPLPASAGDPRSAGLRHHQGAPQQRRGPAGSAGHADGRGG